MTKTAKTLQTILNISDLADTMHLIDETEEVRLLIADVQLKSERLVKILAKRVAGNIQENTGNM